MEYRVDRTSLAELDSATREHRGRNVEAHGRRGGERFTRHIGPVGRSTDWTLPDGTVIAADLDPSALTDAQLERMATTALVQAFPGETHVIGYRFDSKAEVIRTDDMTRACTVANHHSWQVDAFDTDTLHAATRDVESVPESGSTADLVSALSDDRERFVSRSRVKPPAPRYRARNRRRAGDPSTETVQPGEPGSHRITVAQGVTRQETFTVTRLPVVHGERVAVGHTWQNRPQSRDQQRAARAEEREMLENIVEHSPHDSPAATVAQAVDTLANTGAVTVRTLSGQVRVSRSTASGRVTLRSTIPGTPVKREARSIERARDAIREALDAK